MTPDLTPEEKQDIVMRYGRGDSTAQIAKKYSIGAQAVSKLGREAGFHRRPRITHKEPPPPPPTRVAIESLYEDASRRLEHAQAEFEKASSDVQAIKAALHIYEQREA